MIEFDRLLHGGDYNPEQWLEYPQILNEDIKYLIRAKINTVTLGVFSWAVLEPKEGIFKFEWLKDVINSLYENGISVILSTPSGARPKWMADKYPEVLRVDETRQRNLFGLRHNHCYTSPVYREKVRIINGELAKHFGHHPAVILWHISNEYGGECHCPLCQHSFREWLKERYQSIEELNRRWCTTFWSHVYQNFEQIESPSPRGENSLSGLILDWKRFVTDRTVDFVKHEIASLHAATSNKPVTTNMMYDYNGLNYHKFADILDIISWDTYPTWHKEPEYLTAMDNAMQHDIMRCIKKQPFLIMESAPSCTDWQSVSKLKKPGMHEAASLQAIAHGSNSVLYFQIRQSIASAEKFHGAVIDHYGGKDTRVFREVCEVGNVLENLQELVHTKVQSQIAVIYDWENRWALEASNGPRNKGLFYKETVEKSYYAFRKTGLNVDVIDMEQEIKDYKIVSAPLLYMFRKGFEKKIRSFVENGGIFILTYWSGIVDENDRCFLGGTPHDLMDVLGLRGMEIDGLYDGETNSMCRADDIAIELKENYRCKHLCELIKLSTAKALMVFGDDFYKGMPALTENLYRNGKAYYICSDVEQKLYDDLYQMLVKENGVTTILNTDIPEGLEVSERSSDTNDYIIIQNFRREEVKLELPVGKYQVLYGDYKDSINSLGTVVLKKSY